MIACDAVLSTMVGSGAGFARWRGAIARLGAVLLAVLTVGCGTIPTAGPLNNLPSRDAVLIEQAPAAQRPEQGGPSVALINVRDGAWANGLYAQKADGDWPAVGEPGNLKINIGDSIAVTIYEERAGGLFIPQEAGVRPGNFINLPDQVVDASGNIVVPYVGKVEVIGKSPLEVSRQITQLLANRAINPQVVVSYAARAGAEVSVLGDVNAAQRHPLSFEGERVLDAIARAGGPRYAAYETLVTLQRGGTERTLLLDKIVLHPENNIYLQPRDTLYLFKEASTFSVFGAVTRTGEFEFGRRSLSLAQALGKASGLDSYRADAGEVYVYRKIPKSTLLGMMETGPDRAEALKAFPGEVPSLLRFNLRDPGGYHLTQNFQVRDQDVVFVPDADTVNMQKMLDVIFPASASAVNIKTLN